MPPQSRPYWPPEDAQQWLPDILRLAETSGPQQRIRTEETVIALTASPRRVRTAVDPERLTLGSIWSNTPARLPSAGNSG